MQTHAARGDSRMLARAMGIAMATVVAATTVVLLPRAVLVLFSMVAGLRSLGQLVCKRKKYITRNKDCIDNTHKLPGVGS